jgi:PAS domain S-box-containing protein
MTDAKRSTIGFANGKRSARSSGDPAPADPLPLAELTPWDATSVADLPSVVYIHEGGRYVEIGPSVEHLTGIPREEWLRGDIVWEDLLHEDDRERIAAEGRRCRRTQESYRVQYRAAHRSGDLRYFREEAELVFDDRGEATHWLGLMIDITDLVETKQELWKVQTRYGALVEQIPAVVYVDLADEAMTTTYVSPRIEDMLGNTAQEHIEDPSCWERMIHPEDREAAVATYLEGRDSGAPFEMEYRMIATDGRIVWIHDSALVICDAAGEPALVQGVLLDITARKEAEERIAFLAYHDELTGLANHARFDDLLQRALARAQRSGTSVAVLSVDLDRFRLVNDSLGHAAGDELLREVAERLEVATRETDLVARQAGDEFVVWLADLEHGHGAGPGGNATTDGKPGPVVTAEAVAQRIHESLQQPFEIAGTELFATASIGISLFPDDARDASTLLGHANTAMHQSKTLGPGRTMVYASGTQDSLARLSMTTRLRKAVEQEQWVLHYQPVVDIADGTMVGVEALVRWLDPQGNLLPPGVFIPLAEEMGLIEAIGGWVIDEIRRQDEVWRAAGLDLDIAFNLSPRQLLSDAALQDLLERIDADGSNAHRLTVEITESTAMTDPQRTIGFLHDLHERGLRLAIDDFGSGYSSLARLKEMPVDILKIDRSMVSGIDLDPTAGSMVSAMISLAANLHMLPLAEGIETQGEWQFLAARGCTLGQGFLFSEPVSSEEIVALHGQGGRLPRAVSAADAVG